jgi:hypothetical protein
MGDLGVPLLLAFALAALLYLPARSIPFYADDYQWHWDPPPASILHFFAHANPHQPNAYRPIQAAFLLAVQRAFASATWPIHVVVLGGHFLLAGLVYAWMRQAGFPRLDRLFASTLLLVSQAAVHAVASNDTLSQVYSTLFGVLALVLLERSLRLAGGSAVSRSTWLWPYVGSLGAFAAALLAKETGVSLAPMTAVTLVSARRDLARNRPFEIVLRLLPFAGIALVYLWVRRELHLVGLENSTSERYRIDLGPKVLVNLGLFAFQSFLPLDSPRVFLALEGRELLVAAAAVCATVALAWIVLRQCLQSPRRPLLAVLGGLGLLALFPVFLLAKVSELYLYNALPFVAILTGHAVGRLCAEGTRPRARALAWLLAIGMLASHCAASRVKIAMMASCGEEAQRLLTEVTPFLPAVPAGGALLLVDPPRAGANYSIFLMSGFRPLLNGLDRLQEIARRSDFKAYLVEGSDCAFLGHREAIALTLNSRNQVVRDLRVPRCP